MENIIEISHLNKSFQEIQAVVDLSFRVKEGELFAFLGVNGAGSFPVSRRKLLDRECFVTSFRQGGYTSLRCLCVYPLWTCRPQTVLTNRPPPASCK